MTTSTRLTTAFNDNQPYLAVRPLLPPLPPAPQVGRSTLLRGPPTPGTPTASHINGG